MRFLKPGAVAFDALAGVTVDTYKAVLKPGRKMLESKSQFVRPFGAFWLAFFGVIAPLFLLKCVAGLALTGDPFFAWRH